MKPKICVVGSANIDQVSYVKRTPNDGETFLATRIKWVLVEKERTKR